MTRDEYNQLLSIQSTIQRAFNESDKFWMKETMAQGLMSIDALVNTVSKQHVDIDRSIMQPCPNCNSTGLVKHSFITECDWGGANQIQKGE